MSVRILFTLFFLFMISLNAQKMLHGTIVIDEYDGVQENVEILNLTQNTKVISTNYSFEIEANILDELLFESAITTPRKLKISQTIYNNGSVEIHLDRYIVNLKEINASNALTGDLKKDANSVKVQEKFEVPVEINIWDLQNMGREEPVKIENGQLPTQVDIIKIAGLIGALFKQKDTRIHPKRNIEPQKSLDEIRAYLGDDFFIKEINIPLAEIPFFMEFVLQKHKNLLTDNYLDIITHFNNEVQSYLKRDKTKMLKD